MNLIESIQKNLGHYKIHKVDPNTQDVRPADKAFGTDGIAQAAIPATLIGIYNYAQTDEGAENLLSGVDGKRNFTELIFKDRKDSLIDAIAAYAGATVSATEKETAHIVEEAVRLISGEADTTGKKDYASLRTLLNSQKDTILLYLPAAVQTGYLLNNNNLDDKTNKMEGPVSSLLHKIEKAFNVPATDREHGNE